MWAIHETLLITIILQHTVFIEWCTVDVRETSVNMKQNCMGNMRLLDSVHRDSCPNAAHACLHYIQLCMQF